MNNYVIDHLHTDLSNGFTTIDSVTKFEDYIKKAVQLNMKAIAFTEHGNVFSWVKKKQMCDKYGIKYIHGVEAYVTYDKGEKIRDNYHICLYSKNWEGVKELNKLLSNASAREDNHFYYVPRITFEELMNTSNNIIMSTACLGGLLYQTNEYKKKLNEEFINFLVKNKHRAFLEIQHHNVEEQKEYNKYLYNLSLKYNLRLKVGTDTHALNKTHLEGRKILQKAKNIHFDNEDGWDLTLKTYDELVEAYRVQNSLSMDVVKEAIDNTNVLADMIEEFELDTNYKYPKLYKNPNTIFNEKLKQGIINRGINKYPNYKTEYLPRIKNELETFNHNKVIDYMLLEENIKAYARTKNIHCGPGRGSVTGSIIAYLLGITDMDSIKHNLNFERFMHNERISLADIDSDWFSDDRDFVKDYIFNLKDVYCSEIITFNTVALKGAIRDVGRALEIPLKEVDCICKSVEEQEDYYREKYPELFKYVDIIMGTVVSIGSHPAGIVVSPIPLDENVGTIISNKSGLPVTQVYMKEVDFLNYVKLDVLGLDNVGIINKTCELAGIERLTPDNVPDDEKVWQSMTESTLAVFQWESNVAYSYLKGLFNPKVINRIKEKNPNFKYIDLFSVGNAAIRPAGASYRNELAQGIFHDNGHEALNNLLSSTQGYLVYQEQIMDFLHLFCGFTKGEADMVRRGLAKKEGTDQYIPRIKQGFIKTMTDKHGISTTEAENLIESFLKVIEDASNYAFSLNHSQVYSYIGYMCAYLRYYYPLEFLTVLLQINKDDIEKTTEIIKYANSKNIKVQSIKFGKSKGDYFFDKKLNIIYRGVGSIKGLNREIGEDLYNISLKNRKTFTEVIVDIKEFCKINSAQLTTLIKLDYFDEYGGISKLLSVVHNYDKYSSRKTFKKDTFLEHELLRKYSNIETEKMFKELDYKELCIELEKNAKNEDLPVSEKIKYSIMYTGSINNIYDVPKNQYAVLNCNSKYTPILGLYRLCDGKTITVKINKKDYFKEIIDEGDAIKVTNVYTKNKMKKVDNKWIKLDEVDIYVSYIKI